MFHTCDGCLHLYTKHLINNSYLEATHFILLNNHIRFKGLILGAQFGDASCQLDDVLLDKNIFTHYRSRNSIKWRQFK